MHNFNEENNGEDTVNSSILSFKVGRESVDRAFRSANNLVLEKSLTVPGEDIRRVQM